MTRCNPANQTLCGQTPGARGFVLPYVLLVIAILALAGTIAATRLQNTTQTLASIAAQNRTDRMISNAEAVVSFALLSANPLQGVYDLNPESPVQTEFGPMGLDGRQMDPRTAEAIRPDLWSVRGGLRQVQTPDGPVYVSLQDISGLPSLNTPNRGGFQQLLVRAGASPREAQLMITKLLDYIDSDDVKRPGGAEASDYTLRNMTVPSNSPLRSFKELSNVMGWAEVIPRLDMDMIKRAATIQSGTEFRASLARDPNLGARRPSLLADNSDSVIDGVLRRETQSSQNMRLTFWAQRASGPDAGLWDERIVEFSRKSSHITQPYRRLWVLDATVLETQTEFSQSGLTAAQLTELDHVIDPASLRR